jgi:hypothetical protein
MRAGALGRGRRYFERAEAAREGDLGFVGHFLIAKDQDRVRFEGSAHRPVSGIVIGHVGKRHAAQFGGKAGT